MYVRSINIYSISKIVGIKVGFFHLLNFSSVCIRLLDCFLVPLKPTESNWEKRFESRFDVDNVCIAHTSAKTRRKGEKSENITKRQLAVFCVCIRSVWNKQGRISHTLTRCFERSRVKIENVLLFLFHTHTANSGGFFSVLKSVVRLFFSLNPIIFYFLLTKVLLVYPCSLISYLIFECGAVVC